MFQRLVRRISTSFFPRPDRPWNDDVTSTAPQIQIGKKRRFDDDDDDDTDAMHPPSTPATPGTPDAPGTPRKELAYGSVMKKQKVKVDVDMGEAVADGEEKGEGQTTQSVNGDALATEEAVKEVTEGVREVEIRSSSSQSAPSQQAEAEAEDAVVPESRSSASPADESLSEATVSGVPVEAATAAAVPLPDSPVLQAQTEETEVQEVHAGGVKEAGETKLNTGDEASEVKKLEVKDVKVAADVTKDEPSDAAT